MDENLLHMIIADIARGAINIHKINKREHKSTHNIRISNFKVLESLRK